MFLRDAIDDDLLSADTGGWLRLQLRANASFADVVLPISALMFVNLSAALLPWWTTVALLPGVAIACGALQYAAGMVAGGHTQRPRMSVILVAALLVVGCALFVTQLGPALREEYPKLVVFEAVMFASNAVVFWRTVFNDPGTLPQGTAASPQQLAPARLCTTCNAFRPLRSKHDPFIGRCVRCVLSCVALRCLACSRVGAQAVRPLLPTGVQRRWRGQPGRLCVVLLHHAWRPAGLLASVQRLFVAGGRGRL